MLTLLIFPGDARNPTHSPFCLKAMCLLEMAGQDWQPEFVQDFSTLPLGRVPVLRVGDRLIPDSAHIQEYLESRGATFNAGLTKDQLAQSHALIRMTEESLRLGLVHDRWLDPEAWPIMRANFFATVPEVAREQVAGEVQAQVRAGLESNGIARFDPADRVRRLTRDIDALARALGQGPFLFGDAPTAADAAIAPVVDMILQLPVETGLRAAMQAHRGFAPYIARVREAIYPPMERLNNAVMPTVPSDADAKLSA